MSYPWTGHPDYTLFKWRGFWLGWAWTGTQGESSHTMANLAAYHHPQSVTWRWVLNLSLPSRGWETRWQKAVPRIRFGGGPGCRYRSVSWLGWGLSLATQEHLFSPAAPRGDEGGK